MISHGNTAAAAILRRGIFAVNKKKDITSAGTLNHLKDILHKGNLNRKIDISKGQELGLSIFSQGLETSDIRMGHGGTLDQTAHGVLGNSFSFKLVRRFGPAESGRLNNFL